jgi:hypothetical protein
MSMHAYLYIQEEHESTVAERGIGNARNEASSRRGAARRPWALFARPDWGAGEGGR